VITAPRVRMSASPSVADPSVAGDHSGAASRSPLPRRSCQPSPIHGNIMKGTDRQFVPLGPNRRPDRHRSTRFMASPRATASSCIGWPNARDKGGQTVGNLPPQPDNGLKSCAGQHMILSASVHRSGCSGTGVRGVPSTHAYSGLIFYQSSVFSQDKGAMTRSTP
jgi:hypothetical protein